MYPTSEHAYQASKFEDEELIEEVRAARSPMESKNIAKKYKDRQIKNHSEIKVGIMKEIVRAKIEQHDEVRETLLSTGDAVIIENSPVDAFWGGGADQNGENQLGKILMSLREEFRNKLNS